MRSRGPKSQLNVGSLVILVETSFDHKRGPVGTLSSPLLGDLIRITFIYFKNFSLALSFYIISQMSLNSNCPSSYSPHQPYFLSPSDPPIPVPTSPQVYLKIYCIFFSQEDPCVGPSSFLYS